TLRFDRAGVMHRVLFDPIQNELLSPPLENLPPAFRPRPPLHSPNFPGWLWHPHADAVFDWQSIPREFATLQTLAGVPLLKLEGGRTPAYEHGPFWMADGHAFVSRTQVSKQEVRYEL